MSNENRIQFFQISLEELKSLIIEAVNSSAKQSLKKGHNNIDPKIYSYNEVLLTRKEAAAFLKISTTTLWSLDKSQQLPAKRLNGKVLYIKSELLTFLNNVA